MQGLVNVWDTRIAGRVVMVSQQSGGSCGGTSSPSLGLIWPPLIDPGYHRSVSVCRPWPTVYDPADVPSFASDLSGLSNSDIPGPRLLLFQTRVKIMIGPGRASTTPPARSVHLHPACSTLMQGACCCAGGLRQHPETTIITIHFLLTCNQ